MNQKRMVHSSIHASGQFSRLSRDARLTFIGTITLGDDDGRLKGSPALLRSQLFPYDDDVKVSDVSKWLDEIVAQNLLIRYEIDGEPYLYHPKWESYQHIREDRRKDSNIPAPTFDFPEVATIGQPDGNQPSTKRRHSIVKDSKVKDSIDTVAQEAAFAAFWDLYPKKKSKKDAWKAWLKVKYTPELGAEIMRGLTAAVASDGWTKEKGRYIPHAATWINGERWEDEVEPAKKRTGKYDKLNTKTVRGN